MWNECKKDRFSVTFMFCHELDLISSHYAAIIITTMPYEIKKNEIMKSSSYSTQHSNRNLSFDNEIHTICSITLIKKMKNEATMVKFD